MTPDYFLRSARLGFREWSPADAELAWSLWGDPAVTRLIDARNRLSRAQVLEKLDAEIALQSRTGAQYWPVFLIATDARGDGDAFVGCCGLRPHDPPAGVHELGVHIGSKWWRRGFAYEATTAACNHAFDVLGVSALFAGHNPANEASRRLLGKLGFRYTHDEYYAPTGLRHPSYLLTASERRTGKSA